MSLNGKAPDGCNGNPSGTPCEAKGHNRPDGAASTGVNVVEVVSVRARATACDAMDVV